LVWFFTSLTLLYQFGGVFKAETKRNYPFFWWFFPYHRELCEGKTFQKPDPTLKCYNFFSLFVAV